MGTRRPARQPNPGGGVPAPQKTGLRGLDQTLKAEVIHGSSKLELTLEPIGEGEPGYRAAFIPTAAGKYTFHITGTIDGTSVDETFTSSPTGFDEVREAASGQFPVTLPTIAELAAEARAARRAGATRLATEDLQGGRLIGGVRIENPFLWRQSPCCVTAPGQAVRAVARARGSTWPALPGSASRGSRASNAPPRRGVVVDGRFSTVQRTEPAGRVAPPWPPACSGQQ